MPPGEPPGAATTQDRARPPRAALDRPGGRGVCGGVPATAPRHSGGNATRRGAAGGAHCPFTPPDEVAIVPPFAERGLVKWVQGPLFSFMAMQREAVLKDVETTVRPAVEGLGYELVAVQLGSEFGRWVLRLLVDRPGGITLQECAQLSREVSPHLDVADVIPWRYVLEVSSPGVRRPLTRAQDFERFRDERVVVRTREAIGGRKSFRGSNRGLDQQGHVVIEEVDGGVRHAIPLDAIREARLDPDLPF